VRASYGRRRRSPNGAAERCGRVGERAGVASGARRRRARDSFADVPFKYRFLFHRAVDRRRVYARVYTVVLSGRTCYTSPTTITTVVIVIRFCTVFPVRRVIDT